MKFDFFLNFSFLVLILLDKAFNLKINADVLIIYLYNLLLINSFYLLKKLVYFYLKAKKSKFFIQFNLEDWEKTKEKIEKIKNNF